MAFHASLSKFLPMQIKDTWKTSTNKTALNQLHILTSVYNLNVGNIKAYSPLNI